MKKKTGLDGPNGNWGFKKKEKRGSGVRAAGKVEGNGIAPSKRNFHLRTVETPRGRKGVNLGGRRGPREFLNGRISKSGKHRNIENNAGKPMRGPRKDGHEVSNARHQKEEKR